MYSQEVAGGSSSGSGGASAASTANTASTTGTGGTGGEPCVPGLPGGTPTWTHGYDASGAQGAGSASVAIDADGNLISAGNYTGSIDFGCGALADVGSSNVFLVKLSPSGACLWSKGFSSGPQAQVLSVGVDPSGGVVVVGFFDDSIDFGSGPLVSVGGVNPFVARFESDGTGSWSESFGDGQSQSASVAVDATGNAVVIGFFQGSLGFGSTRPSLDGGANDALFVVKLDPSGAPVWSNGFADAGGSSVAVDALGNVFVGGVFSGSVDFGGCSLTGTDPEEGFVVKLDPSGACLWGRSLGITDGNNVAVDVSGNVWVTGLFDNSVDLDDCALTGTDPQDGFVVKLDPSGACLWSKSLGNASGQSIAVDASENVFITGALYGTVDLGGGKLTSAGGEDVLFASFAADGSYRWAKGFGNAEDELGTAIAVDPSCHVVIVGEFEGTLDIGGNPVGSTGSDGAFVAQFER